MDSPCDRILLGNACLVCITGNCRDVLPDFADPANHLDHQAYLGLVLASAATSTHSNLRYNRLRLYRTLSINVYEAHNRTGRAACPENQGLAQQDVLD
jgi:hypothetical protein